MEYDRAANLDESVFDPDPAPHNDDPPPQVHRDFADDVHSLLPVADFFEHVLCLRGSLLHLHRLPPPPVTVFADLEQLPLDELVR